MYKNILARIKDFYTKYRLYFSLTLTLIISAGLIYYVRTRSADFKIIYNISLVNIIMLSLASVLFRIALGYNFHILMLFFNVKMAIKEWLGLTTISTMTNYLLPAKGGTAAQAVYIKKVYGLSYAQFLSSTIGFFIITFMTNAAIGLILSIIAWNLGIMTSDKIIFFFIITTAVTIFAFILMRESPKFKIANSYVKNVIKGLERFRHEPGRTTELIITQLFVIIAIGLRLFFAFRSVNIDINIMGCIIIALFTSFFIFLSLTPANLGIKEFFITLSSTSLGVTPAQGLLVALIDRAFDIIVSFIGGAIFSFILSNMQWWKKNAVNGKNA